MKRPLRSLSAQPMKCGTFAQWEKHWLLHLECELHSRTDRAAPARPVNPSLALCLGSSILAIAAAKFTCGHVA